MSIPFWTGEVEASGAHIDDYNQFVANVGAPAMGDALERYKESLEALGYTVEAVNTASGSQQIGGYPVYETRITRDGVTVNGMLSAGLLQNSTPEQIAAWNVRDHNVASVEAGQMFWTGESYTTTQPPTIATSTPVSAPGPAPTVASGTPSTQTTQAPPTPNAGTIVQQPAPSSSEARHTFDEWNYINAQQTGRTGPAPETVGVVNRNALLTLAEWRTLTDPWFAGQTTGGATGSETGTTGGTTGTTGGIPTKTLVWSGVAVVVLYLLVKGGR